MERKKKFAAAMLFMLPFVALYTLFTIWPVFQGMWISLWKWGLMGSQRFVGLDNYVKAYGDKNFLGALTNTVVFTAITVPLLMVTAVILALLANRPTKVRKFARSAFYIPSVLSVSVVSFIAIYFSEPHTGFLNNFLHDLHLIPRTSEPQWLLGHPLNWVTLSVTTVWWTVGFSMLLYLAALQEIPDEMYEAAEIDGASSSQQLFRITLPLLNNTHWLVLLLQVLACFKVFGQTQLITAGGPGKATRSIVQYIYEQGFVKDNLGYASAMSFALFFILLAISLVQVGLQRRSER